MLAAARRRDAHQPGTAARRHQREVGTGYFDAVTQAVSQGKSSTTALAGSTEAEQFYGDKQKRHSA